MKTSTVDRACKLLRGRANVGEVKYGVTIDRDDLSASDWAQHALEELLDGAQYLIRFKDEVEALQKENAELKQELKHNQKQEFEVTKDDDCFLSGIKSFVGDEVYIYGSVWGVVEEIKIARTSCGVVTAWYLVRTAKGSDWRLGKELSNQKREPLK